MPYWTRIVLLLLMPVCFVFDRIISFLFSSFLVFHLVGNPFTIVGARTKVDTRWIQTPFLYHVVWLKFDLYVIHERVHALCRVYVLVQSFVWMLVEKRRISKLVLVLYFIFFSKSVTYDRFLMVVRKTVEQQRIYVVCCRLALCHRILMNRQHWADAIRRSTEKNSIMWKMAKM